MQPSAMWLQSRRSMLAEGSSCQRLGFEIKSGIECMTLRVLFLGQRYWPP
jgi:hypothetical protein